MTSSHLRRAADDALPSVEEVASLPDSRGETPENGGTQAPPCLADQGEPCTCANGIGCVHVPFEEW